MDCCSVCPVCGQEKKIQNKYCSYKCRNIVINRNKDYKKQSEKISKSLKERANDLRIEKEVNCERCDKIFKIKTNVKGLVKQKIFCSKKCSHSRPQSENTKKKISSKIKEIIKTVGCVGCVKFGEKHNCINCDSLITVSKKYCNKKCQNNFFLKNANEYAIYKKHTSFMFNLADYKNEYDFSLIENFGWYKPTNRGNNLGGVSRDHIFSVREGYNKKINPLLLAHPANCQLLVHNENVSKNCKNNISIDELLQKIKKFENKYGVFYKEHIETFINIEDLKKI